MSKNNNINNIFDKVESVSKITFIFSSLKLQMIYVFTFLSYILIPKMKGELDGCLEYQSMENTLFGILYGKFSSKGSCGPCPLTSATVCAFSRSKM